jgi:preprotein translocase subunit SecG
VSAALHIVQGILSVFLMGLILLQSKGAGLGSIFGGNESVFTTRRGIERMLFNFTIGASAAFLIFSLLVAKFA